MIIKDNLRAKFGEMENKIIDIVRSHMISRPYSITCSQCEEDLKYDFEIDDELDLIIKVKPCICS